MAADRPRIEPFGDAAVLITLGDRAELELTARAHAIARAIEAHRSAIPSVGRPVPAHASVLVPIDPLSDDPVAAGERLRALVDDALAQPSTLDDGSVREIVEIPVRYGGPDGPDLEDVAAATGLSPSDVADLHASATYRVLFLGFAPGFAYLGPVPEALAIPRRSTPREHVPAGSVAIAGGQTAVYPRRMPGGWHLIGRTDVAFWSLDRPSPSLLAAGDHVRFVPASGPG